MNLTRMMYTSAAAAGIAAAGLFGLGIGTASADPGQPCGGWNAPACQPGPNNGPRQLDPTTDPTTDPATGSNNNNGPNNGPGGWQPDDNNNGPDDWQHPDNGPVDWQHRGIDQGRQDHQPFNYERAVGAADAGRQRLRVGILVPGPVDSAVISRRLIA